MTLKLDVFHLPLHLSSLSFKISSVPCPSYIYLSSLHPISLSLHLLFCCFSYLCRSRVLIATELVDENREVFLDCGPETSGHLYIVYIGLCPLRISGFLYAEVPTLIFSLNLKHC